MTNKYLKVDSFCHGKGDLYPWLGTLSESEIYRQAGTSWSVLMFLIRLGPVLDGREGRSPWHGPHLCTFKGVGNIRNIWHFIAIQPHLGVCKNPAPIRWVFHDPPWAIFSFQVLILSHVLAMRCWSDLLVFVLFISVPHSTLGFADCVPFIFVIHPRW